MSLFHYFRISVISLILIYVLLPYCVFAHLEGTVTVRLFEAHRPIRSLEIFPPFQIIGSAGSATVKIKTLATINNGNVCLRNVNLSNRAVIIRSRTIFLQGINAHPIALTTTDSGKTHKYRGRILLSVAQDGTLEIENIVSTRDYVTDVVAAEAPLNAPTEMLKAQSVLVQTLLLNKGSGTIGDSTTSQCYLGTTLERPAIRSAVSSVWGRTLSYRGVPVRVYYHSTCAGGTSAGTTYFHLPKNGVPYLSALNCKNCKHSPFWSPTRTTIPHDLFVKVFGDRLPVVLESDYSKRPLLIELADGGTMTGYDFWIKLGQSFGWDKAPGSRFSLKEGKNQEIIIESTGAGHGIGLCQWGASALAHNGKTYKQILQYYFPGCEIR